MEQNTEETDKKLKPYLFQEGYDPRRNLNGRSKGALGFKTIFKAAIKKIAKENKIKKLDVEVGLVIRAIAEARGGNYQYYRDIFDRVYGQAKSNLDLTSGGKPIPILNVSNNTSDNQNTEPQEKN